MEVTPPEQHTISESPGESVTTLWLAPNVGIVKFHQETEDIFLKTIPDPALQSAAAVKAFELRNYEIRSDTSETNEND